MKMLRDDRVHPPEGFQSAFGGSSLVRWLHKSLFMRCSAVIDNAAVNRQPNYTQEWEIRDQLKEYLYEDVAREGL